MVKQTSERTEELYRALMEPPIGSNQQALIYRIRKAVEAYEKASWFGRVLFWAAPTTIAGLIVSWERIEKFFGGGAP